MRYTIAVAALVYGMGAVELRVAIDGARPDF